MNKYGYFDDEKREYVISRPDTPLPWINYLGFKDFFGICSQTGGGYTFWKDARMRRLTRYRYNNTPSDQDGRILYINHDNDLWSPMWKPCRKELDSFEARHGLGYTEVTSQRNGVEVAIRMFVPVDDNAELWQVKVRNLSGSKQSLKLFSYVEFCFYEALVDMTNYQRNYSIGEVEVEDSKIFHKTEYRERRDHYTLFASTTDIDGFDTDRDKFIGVHHGLQDPVAPTLGECCNSIAHGWNPVGAHQLNLELEPDESKDISFILAYLKNEPEEKFDEDGLLNKTEANKLLEKYHDPRIVDAAFELLKKEWSLILGGSQVSKLPHADMQRMINTWTPYQCMATFNLSRSASGYETGIGRGMGFRDSNQDLLGFVHMIPERARERIIDIASTQLSDGTCFHQYQPLTKQGNADIGGGFNDDPLWLVLSSCAYIRETGDVSLLEEKVGYADQTDSDATLLDHLELSIQYTLRERGPHKLPLIGHADWNDCLNLNCFSEEPNESFQIAGDIDGSIAESLMIAGLFLYATRELSELYEFLERQKDVDRIESYHGSMLDAVEAHGWDGEWYLRAYDAEGKPVGSHKNEEGQIYIESQGWLIMGGAGLNNGRAQQTLESVDKRLFSRDTGVALIDPAYSKYKKELGEVTSYPPGYKENGGVFSHNNTWIQISWTKINRGDKAVEYWDSICPSMKGDYDLYRAEPYVYAQTTSSQHSPLPGEGKNTWLTGTAAWSYVTAVHHILGIRPYYDGLIIDPKIPSDWDGFEFTRNFRGTRYQISVKNFSGSNDNRITSVSINGINIDGNKIPLIESDQTVRVEVQLRTVAAT